MHPVGAFAGSEPGGYPRFAGGEGLAVAPAVGAFGQGLTVSLDFADVGFAFVGVGGDGEQGGIGVVASRMRLTVWLSGFRWAGGRRSRARPARGGEAFHGPVVEPGEHHAGLVDLIASAAEILADRAEVGAAADGVFQQPTAWDGSV